MAVSLPLHLASHPVSFRVCLFLVSADVCVPRLSFTPLPLTFNGLTASRLGSSPFRRVLARAWVSIHGRFGRRIASSRRAARARCRSGCAVVCIVGLEHMVRWRYGARCGLFNWQKRTDGGLGLAAGSSPHPSRHALQPSRLHVCACCACERRCHCRRFPHHPKTPARMPGLRVRASDIPASCIVGRLYQRSCVASVHIPWLSSRPSLHRSTHPRSHPDAKRIRQSSIARTP